MNKATLKLKKSKRVDISLIIPVILLAFFGTVMVYSAGYAYAYARYDDALYFVKKQSVWLFLGLSVMTVSTKLNSDIFKKISKPLYCITIILLLLVLIIGFVGNGAKRWISIGPLTIQPSEIAKISLIMMLADYFSKQGERLLSKRRSDKFIYGTLIPILIMLLPILLVMLQKHLSCIIILSLIGVSMITVSGTDLRYISAFGVLGMAGIASLALFTDYTKERITVWQNPEAYKLTGGWQTLQGLMAIGSGGVFGVGFGKSVMKYSYVSEPANDMIFAILCEELGLVGALIVLFLFLWLTARGIRLSLRIEDTFKRLVGIGICIKMAIQVLLNVAVVTNSIPNTGISLPFFSYGGSSLVMLFFEMGMLISITKEAVYQK
ncbi:MAG: FtsW/RodA/SpoVE family cell cycle protein [Clostridia bacterium]|nr:FtsW/RodA/SpoVE family cell cycle protein [Clostridia bacterium]